MMNKSFNHKRSSALSRAMLALTLSAGLGTAILAGGAASVSAHGPEHSNSDPVAQNGNANANGGVAAAQNGNASANGGTAYSENGDANANGGIAAAQNGCASANGGFAASENGNASANAGLAASQNGCSQAKAGTAISENGTASAVGCNGFAMAGSDGSHTTATTGSNEYYSQNIGGLDVSIGRPC